MVFFAGIEYQYQESEFIISFPVIMFLWVNLHGGFISGLLLIGIYWGGNFIGAMISDGDEKKLYNKKAKYYFFILFLCLISSLINPHFYRILLFPFSLISEKTFMDNVSESYSPNFHDPIYIVFELMLLLSIIIFVISRRRLGMVEIVLALLFLFICPFILAAIYPYSL